MQIFFGFLFSYLYVFILLVMTELLKKKFNIKEEFSRKIIHIGVGLTWFITYHYFKNSWHILVLSITFIIFNYISLKRDFVKSMDNKDTKGIIYYPISVLIMSVFSVLDADFLIPYGIGLFCMAFADGLSPIIASIIKSKPFKNGKTISGTITVFIISLIVILLMNYYFILNLNYLKIIFIAIVSALIELFSKKGLDNLFLPVGISILSYILIFL